MNPKILKNPYFYSAKMAPKKVDNLLPFKVANLMPLWRPKCGQPSASPAYIYIYMALDDFWAHGSNIAFLAQFYR